MSNEIANIDDMPAISSDALVSMAEQAEKRIEAVKAIKRSSMKVTNENDWVDQNGKPYLQASGGEKIARLFGISWTIEEPSIEYEESGHYTYTYKGVFSLSSASIEAIGTRSSKDPFFRKYKYENNEKIELPVSAISKDDVKKSAYTNLIGNGITRLLGIRNLTYDDLKASGLDVSKITKVEYKKGGKPPITSPQTKPNTEPGKSENQKVVTCIKEITQKPGKNNSVRYKISGETADYYAFDSKFALLAKTAQESGLRVAIQFSEGKFGNDIQGMDIIEPDAVELGFRNRGNGRVSG